MKRRWLDLNREAAEDHSTARPLVDEEQEAIFCRDGGGGTRKKVMRPDGDGFSCPVDADEDPPIAALFDSPGGDD